MRAWRRKRFYSKEELRAIFAKLGYKYKQRAVAKELREFRRANPSTFAVQRDKIPEDLKWVMTSYTPKELKARKCRLYLSRDKSAGVGIMPDGDIVNLFSLKKGNGKYALLHAIRNGGRKLDCFDGGLVKYYSQFGFKEYHREPNWTPGKPDVVYMRRLRGR